MSNLPYLVAAFAIGASLTLQPPINAVVARVLGNPLLAACVSIAISLVTVILVWMASGRGTGDITQVRSLPWWVIIGGVIGVVFVAGSVVVAPVLGVALFFVCVVAGQLVCATVADHFGAFGMAVQPVTGLKLLGLGLVFGGAALVRGG